MPAFIETAPDQMAQDKQDYLDGLVAPLDGMWHSFIEAGQHYKIKENETAVGYCVVNEAAKLLQLVCKNENPEELFKLLVEQLKLNGAVVATCEFETLSLCLDIHSSLRVNSWMYHLADVVAPHANRLFAGDHFRLLQSEDLQQAVDFCMTAIDCERTWLESYYAGLIQREELFAGFQNGDLIAAGECRPSITQKPYADLGVVVHPEFRSQGIATEILTRLIAICHEKQLTPICSTTPENFGARRAIEKAGFVSQHRVLEIDF